MCYIILSVVVILILIPDQVTAQVDANRADFNNPVSVEVPVTLEMENYSDQNNNIGPLRDWGDDWIYYDDGELSVYFTYYYIWMRVRFTPFATFRLEGIRLNTYNPENDEEHPLKLRVYSENQEDGTLDEMLYEFETDNIPSDWWNHEIDEDGFVVFERREVFSILVGPSPGNGPNGNDQFWFPSGDRVSNSRNSFVAAAFRDGENRGEPDNDKWLNLQQDGLIRANGSYVPEYNDIEPLGVYNRAGFNDRGQWIVLTDSAYTYFVDIVNLGQDISEDDYVVSLSVIDPNGEEIFNHEFSGPSMEFCDSVTIECDSAWTVPEDAVLGQYEVCATVVHEDDIDQDNNTFSLEQSVTDITEQDEEAPEEWIGYVSGDEDNFVPHDQICECGEDVGIILYPPMVGGNAEMYLTDVSFAVHSDDRVRPFSVHIGILNRVFDQIAWIRTLEAETGEAEGWEWFEFQVHGPGFIENEVPAVCYSSEAFVILLEHNERVSIMVDTVPPLSATVSPNMPYTMCYGGEEGIRNAEEGDFAIKAKLVCTNMIGEWWGLLEIQPDSIQFGVDLEQGVDHSRELRFSVSGNTEVNIINVVVNQEDQEFLSIELVDGDINEMFVLQPDDTTVVMVTYHAPQYLHEIETTLRVETNAVIDPLRIIPIHAATTHSDHVDNKGSALPNRLTLLPPHPNPFNAVTQISYHLPTETNVEIGLYDISGCEVITLFSGVRSAGVWSATVDARDLASGLYLVRMNANDQTFTKKLICVK